MTNQEPQPVEPTMEQATNPSLAGESKDSGAGSSQAQTNNEDRIAEDLQQESLTQKTDVDLTKEETLKNVNDVFKKGLEKAVKKANVEPTLIMSIAMTKFKEMGYKFAFSKGNRIINFNSVKNLRKLLDGATRFSSPGRVCSAKAALLNGAAILDEEGNTLTLENSDIDKYLVIIDGQHRYIACLQSEIVGKELIDMDFEIVSCPDSLDDEIVKFNCGNMNWGSEDFRKYNAMKNKKTDTLAEATQEARAILPNASQKFLEYALTEKKDAVRKANVLKGEIPTCEDATKQVGILILKAFVLLANISTKVVNVDMLSALFELKAIKTAKYSGMDFCNLLIMALSKATDDWKLDIKKKIEDKDWVAVKEALSVLIDEQEKNGQPTPEDLEKAESSILNISSALKKPTKGIPNGTAVDVLSSLQKKKKSSELVKSREADFAKAKRALEEARKETGL